MKTSIKLELYSGVAEYLQTCVAAFRHLIKQRCKIGDYVTVDEFVLRNGRAWTPRPLPRGIKRGAMKMCFMNAASLALRRPDLIYCEGYAAGIIPVPHAWCIDNDGNVIDPTWRDIGHDYYGIAIKRAYLIATMAKSRTYGVIDTPSLRWPILQHPKAAWRHPIMDRDNDSKTNKRKERNQ